MKDRVRKMVRNPRKYVPIAAREIFQGFSRVFQDGRFFLQGQMDIHPKSMWPSDMIALTGGFFPKGDGSGRQIRNLDGLDNTRRDMLVLLLRTLIERKIPGAFAELGVFQGSTARLIHHYAPERVLHLFDTFEGFTERSSIDEVRNTGQDISAATFSNTSLERVKRAIGLQNENVRFHKGFFPDSIPPSLQTEAFAFVHLDADLYDAIFEGLKFFYPRIPRYGILVVHDYNAWPGARQAVDEFFRDKQELPIPMPDKSGSALIVKQ